MATPHPPERFLADVDQLLALGDELPRSHGSSRRCAPRRCSGGPASCREARRSAAGRGARGLASRVVLDLENRQVEDMFGFSGSAGSEFVFCLDAGALARPEKGGKRTAFGGRVLTQAFTGLRLVSGSHHPKPHRSFLAWWHVRDALHPLSFLP